jgi:hypothetical protein
MYEFTDWNLLERGEVVHLQAEGTSVRQAIIDDFTEDRRIVWVRLTGLNERKLLLHDDGIGIFPFGCAAPQARHLSVRDRPKEPDYV